MEGTGRLGVLRISHWNSIFQRAATIPYVQIKSWSIKELSIFKNLKFIYIQPFAGGNLLKQDPKCRNHKEKTDMFAYIKIRAGASRGAQ